GAHVRSSAYPVVGGPVDRWQGRRTPVARRRIRGAREADGRGTGSIGECSGRWGTRRSSTGRTASGKDRGSWVTPGGRFADRHGRRCHRMPMGAGASATSARRWPAGRTEPGEPGQFGGDGGGDRLVDPGRVEDADRDAIGEGAPVGLWHGVV